MGYAQIDLGEARRRVSEVRTSFYALAIPCQNLQRNTGEEGNVRVPERCELRRARCAKP